jgi:hypothetical protein
MSLEPVQSLIQTTEPTSIERMNTVAAHLYIVYVSQLHSNGLITHRGEALYVSTTDVKQSPTGRSGSFV